MSLPHKTKLVLVWAEIDCGIAEFVKRLQSFKGVLTHASCQGTIGGGGPNPYRAQVMCSWTPKGYKKLQRVRHNSASGKQWNVGIRSPACDW